MVGITLLGRKSVPLFEEHGEVLAHWSSYRWKLTTLICFDRHLDLKALGKPALESIRRAPSAAALGALNRTFPFEDAATANYGLDNFLYAAINLGWIGRLVWVYPLDSPMHACVAPAKLSSILLSVLSLLGGHGKEVMDTYRLTSAGPVVKISGIELQMTTVELLPQLALDPDTPVDVDLDFFGTETGSLLFSPIEAAKSLAQLGLTNLVSMTASISSGFLAPSLRWVADAFAGELGYQPISASVRRNPAAYILRLLATEKPISSSSLRRLRDVLPYLGGGGWSLLSVIAVRHGDYNQAEISFHRAREHGDGAHWPAYMIGLGRLALGQPILALPWFEFAQGSLTDSIQLHSVSLKALCLARSGRFHESLEAAQDAIWLTPMRRAPYAIGIVAARQTDQLSEVDGIVQKLAILDQFLIQATGKGAH